MELFEILTLVFQFFTLLVLGAALFIAIYGLRPTVHQVRVMQESLDSDRRTRFAELLTHLSERWESPQLARGREKVHQAGASLYKEIKEAYEKASNGDAVAARRLIVLMRVANFFDTMGVLVKLRYLEPKDAKSLFGEAAERYYNYYCETLESAEFKRFLTFFPQLMQELKAVT